MSDRDMSPSAEKLIDKSSPVKSITGDEIPFFPAEIERLEKRKWILAYAGKNAVGAEIGVFRGHFSAVLAEVLQPQKLFLVDPWRRLGPDFGWGAHSSYTGFGKLTTDYAYRDTLRRVGGYKHIDIRVVERFAEEFLGTLEEKLDWVYLDASHKYESTLKELELIDAVLEQDGVIIGDDWQPARNHQHHDVFRAVHEFIRTRPYEIVAAGPAGQWCLRRSAGSTASLAGSGKPGGRRLRVVSRAAEVPWVLHAAIDTLPSHVEPGQPFTIGGLVALSKSAPEGCTLRLSGAEERGVTWNLRSPVMKKRFPDGLNSAKARFRIESVLGEESGPYEILLVDGRSNEVSLFRLAVVQGAA